MRVASRKMQATLVLLLLVLLILTLSLAGLRGWAAYHYRAARLALEHGEFRQADKSLARCLKLWPNDPDTHLLAAQAARRQDDYPRALQHLRVCRQKNAPRDAVSREYQLLEVQQGDLAEADALLDFCSRHPGDAATPLILEALIKGNLQILNTAFKLGVSFQDSEVKLERDRTRREVDMWLRLRTSPAEQVRGLVWRGRLNDFANDKSQAQADLRKALEIDSNDFDARMYLAMSVAQESPQEAAGHFQTLLEQHPDNDLVRFSLAAVFRTLGQLDESRRHLDAMLAANPNNVSALIGRGYLAMDTLHYDEAEKMLRRAVELAPAESESYNALETCLRMEGKWAEAKHFRDRFQEIQADRKHRRKEILRKIKGDAEQERAGAAPRD